MPTFFVIIVLMVIVLAISSIALVANSDVCMGGESMTPEGFVELVIQKGKFEGDMLNVGYYYIVDVSINQTCFGAQDDFHLHFLFRAV